MTLFEHVAFTIKATEAACGLRPVVQARFEGLQPWPDSEYCLELWTLLESIPGHPIQSTVSRETIERAGYAVPERMR